jgi:DNA-binding beta-propeller fold protein YncE
MRVTFAIALLAAALLALTGTVQRDPRERRATGTIAAGTWAYLPGSVLPVRVDGFNPPYRVAVLGQGSMLANGLYAIPSRAAAGSALLVAGNADGLAARSIRIGTPPSANRDLLAVACYDDGLVFHDAVSFAGLGTLAIGGNPSDVAIDAGGRIASADTQGTTLTTLTLRTWSVAQTGGVPFADEIAIDATTRAIFVTNRDIDGSGALTRVLPGGEVKQVATGKTAEGLAIDERRQIVYVANVNDDSVVEIDARTLALIRRFHAVGRVFSLALSPDGTMLYAISNQTMAPPLGAPGSAVAIAVGTAAAPRIVARSAVLTFPLGEALDAAHHTLFVTDEDLDAVDVLDARTLRPKHAPLSTCRTPWKPTIDPQSGLLYVPCARSNNVDVFDAKTYRRAPGAPFATGGYPLAVSVWHRA